MSVCSSTLVQRVLGRLTGVRIARACPRGRGPTPLLCGAALAAVTGCADPASKAVRPAAPDDASAPSDTGSEGSDDDRHTAVDATPGTPCEPQSNAWPMEPWTDAAWAQQEVTPPSGPYPTSAWGAAVADFNGDELLDIFLPQLGSSELFLNKGERAFEEVSSTHLPSGTVTALAATAVDLDGDNDMDVVESGFGLFRLLLNDGGGRFTAAYPVAVDSTTLYLGSSWADMDADGDLDGIVAAFPSAIPSMDEREDPGHLTGAADLLIEATELGWVDASHRLPATNDGHTFLAAWQDLDDDQRPELLVMNDYFITGRTNRAWALSGDEFIDVSTTVGLDHGMESMGLAITDANNDQLPDMLITGWGELAWLVSDPNGGPWIDRRAADGYLLDTAEGQWVGWAAEFADLDNNQAEEAVVSFGYWELAGEADDPDQVNAAEQPDAVFERIGSSMQDTAALWGIDARTYGRGMVAADIDRDGCIELLRRPVFGPATIDSPRCTEANWATIGLRSATANSRAVGARIRIDTADAVQTRWVRAGGTGLAGGGPSEVHVGLGDHETIDRVTVDWPDGSQTVHEGLPVNRHIVIRRTDGMR